MTASKKTPGKPQNRRSRKVEPAWGVKFQELVNTEFDRPAEAAAIEALLRRHIGPDEKKRQRFDMFLHAAQDAYWGTRECNSPTRPQVKAALAYLEAHSAALLWGIENLDFLTERFLQSHAVEHFPGVSMEETLLILKSDLSELHEVAQSLRKAMPPAPRGRAPNDRLNDFVGILAHAFEELTGVDASIGLTVDKESHVPWSPFIAFAWDCLMAVDPDHGLSELAFGEVARKLNRRPAEVEWQK